MVTASRALADAHQLAIAAKRGTRGDQYALQRYETWCALCRGARAGSEGAANVSAVGSPPSSALLRRFAHRFRLAAEARAQPALDLGDLHALLGRVGQHSDRAGLRT